MFGNSREYFPLVSKSQYFSRHINGWIASYFNNSVEQFASFLTSEMDISEKDLKKLKEIVDKKLKEKDGDWIFDRINPMLRCFLPPIYCM